MKAACCLCAVAVSGQRSPAGWPLTLRVEQTVEELTVLLPRLGLSRTLFLPVELTASRTHTMQARVMTVSVQGAESRLPGDQQVSGRR